MEKEGKKKYLKINRARGRSGIQEQECANGGSRNILAQLIKHNIHFIEDFSSSIIIFCSSLQCLHRQLLFSLPLPCFKTHLWFSSSYIQCESKRIIFLVSQPLKEHLLSFPFAKGGISNFQFPFLFFFLSCIPQKIRCLESHPPPSLCPPRLTMPGHCLWISLWLLLSVSTRYRCPREAGSRTVLRQPPGSSPPRSEAYGRQMGSQMVTGTARHRMCRSVPRREWTGTDCERGVRQLPAVPWRGQEL